MISNKLLIISLIVLFLVSGCTKSSVSEGELKEFEVNVRNWVFEPNTITVNQGDRVRIIAIGQDDGTGAGHGIAIPDYNINKVIRKGDRVVVEFVADKKGIFPFYCSVYCGEGHGDQRGKIIVK